jgi:hypothetical protein
MKIIKSIVSAIIFLGLTVFINAQTVDSIKVEQTGDFIKIRYKILNSTPNQIYRVQVLCSINGGLNTEIPSITGDVGDLVAGGKTEYWVVWDVLKDVEELKSAEFIVRAELIKDLSEISKGKDIEWAKKRFHMMLAGDYPGPKVGIRIGYAGSWGIFAVFTYGKIGLKKDARNVTSIPQWTIPYFGLELTKRIVNRKNFQMHLTAGPSLTTLLFFTNTTDSFYKKKFIGLSCGLNFDIKRFTLSLGQVTSIVGDYERKNDLWNPAVYTHINAGFGIRF